MYPTFYDPDLPPAPEGTLAALPAGEAHHAAQVRRIRPGEIIEVVDGRGGRVRGPVHEVAKRAVTYRVAHRGTEPAPGRGITLVQALAKGGRDEAAIEAATEVGADGVIAWESARSVSRWPGDKERKGLARWEAILTAAMKQSRRSHLPKLHGFARGPTLADLLPPARVLVLHETATQALTGVDLPEGGDLAVVVGPEGGLTEDEVDLLTCRGASAVRLGPEVLRTSTAGPAAIAVLNTRLGRW